MNIKQPPIVMAIFLRFLKERHLLVRFINNYNKYSTSRRNGMLLMDYINDKCDKKIPQFIIHGAFIFTDTEEGHVFWMEQSDKWRKLLINNEVIPSIQ